MNEDRVHSYPFFLRRLSVQTNDDVDCEDDREEDHVEVEVVELEDVRPVILFPANRRGPDEVQYQPGKTGYSTSNKSPEGPLQIGKV